MFTWTFAVNGPDDDELSDEDLDNVAGGGPPPPKGND